MTNRTLTALALRIAGIFLFAKLFEQFGAYFLSIFSIAVMTELGKPIDKFYFSLTFLVIVNIVFSLFLFIKAEWISKKLVKTENEIKTELNSKSLTKVILLITGVIWLAQTIYLLPNLIEYSGKLISKLNGYKDIEIPNFAFSSYILKAGMALIIVFKIEKISNWILDKI